MPIITDQEFQRFNEKANELKSLSIDHENLEESYDKTIKYRNIFLVLASIFLIALIAIFLLKSLKPELFINGYKLKARGLTLLETKKYKTLKEMAYQSDLVSEKEETFEEESFSQESIGETTIYAVQVAALKDNNIQLYSDSFTQFSEFEKDGFYKYSIGAFETLEEAQDFRLKIVNLGFNDAFVASYVNGERQRIEEAF